MKSFKQILESYVPAKSPESKKIREDALKVHDKLKQKYAFSEDEHRAIGSYTRSGAHKLNNHLWNKHTGDSTKYMDDEHKDNAAQLNTHLNNHKAPHDIEVHSGTRFDPRNHMNDNSIVHHPAFLSGSIDKTIANNFAHRNSGGEDRHMLKYTVPKGHPGAYIAGASAAEHEKEFLLPSGMNLKHNHTTTEDITENMSSYSNLVHSEPIKYKFHTHHMTLVK